ncbi:MAG: dihydrolipoyl dehydrogenase [Acidobacteriota bacterium]
MSQTKFYDLIVIGSGPGGYVAAIRAAQLGLRTAIVEKDPKFGGTCLHRGCIPTKALLHTASSFTAMQQSEKIGIDLGAEPILDMGKTHAYKDKVVDKNARGVDYLLKKNQVAGIRGFGRLVAPNRVEVERGGVAEVYEARFVLIATGSVPRHIPIADVDGERVIDSDHALELRQVPKSLAVLGAGAVGTEFASIYNAFGAEVTILEMLPRLLPIEDEDASAELAKSFRKRGIRAMVDTRLESVETTGDGVRLHVVKNGSSQVLDAEKLLIAVGRAPVTDNIGLDEIGVAREKGYIVVDEWMKTTVDGVYAIGDVVNTPWLAHVASAEGILAVEHMAGHDGARPIDYDRVPSCTYCEPEVASVGLTEAAARERGHDVAVGKFPFSALGKASILQHTEGFVKVVRETRYDQVLGVHIVGPHATDLIAEACVALAIESTTEELFRTMHAHPTLSEAMAEAAHAASGHAIHF